MPTESRKPEAKSRRILGARDVCLDVVGVPVPRQGQSANALPFAKFAGMRAYDRHQPWKDLIDNYHSNAEQANDMPQKLFTLGVWLCEAVPVFAAVAPGKPAALPLIKERH